MVFFRHAITLGLDSARVVVTTGMEDSATEEKSRQLESFYKDGRSGISEATQHGMDTFPSYVSRLHRRTKYKRGKKDPGVEFRRCGVSSPPGGTAGVCRE